MNRIINILILICLFLTACEHKELCLDHSSHTNRIEYLFSLSYDIEWEYNVENYIDWKQNWNNNIGLDYDDIRPSEPEGVRLHIFNQDYKTEKVYNLNPNESTVHFSDEGHYALLMHNNDTEYIVYQGMESYSTAYATTRGINRASYKGNSLLTRADGEEEVTVNPPDVLYGAYIDSIYVEKSTRADTISFKLYPLTYTYLIQYKIEQGREFIALARGALAGMAHGVNLSNGRTSTKDVTVMFDAKVKDYGVKALVQSFGIPDYPNPIYSRAPRQYGLNLEVRLKDGTIHQFEFDVTDQVAKQPEGGVIIVDGINIDIPQVGGDEENNDGFNIGVEGWGDVVDIPLPL